MKPVLLQPAFILHRRPYRETSFLLELWSYDYGRLTAIAKGARKPKSDWPGLLQPFIALSVSWVGRAEIMTLTHAEANAAIHPLHGENLYAGFYLNELLQALIQKWDPHPHLYRIYEHTLRGLRQPSLQQKYLRQFELQLLQALGYGLLPQSPSALQQAFTSGKYYHFSPEQGFVVTEADPSARAVFSGKNLLAIAKEDWHDESILQDAKRLIRTVLTPLLGTREIYSRQLFAQPAERINHDSEK